ncbi:mitochondrial carnitine/acylcarnitine carrier protein-like [Convolutriloba macropyga]|uniref:mitochondrial carnitine/acylcarnitine carrier protein-like n=1 Tax=Convolutriloba macropyga TaxID=536237 RepID=UPI003F51C07D
MSAGTVSPLKDFLAGGFGGVCLVMSGHPFDTIKVRLQTSNQYTGMLDCVRQIYVKEGPKGYFKGMLAPVMGVAPMYALCFLGFSHGMRIQGYDKPATTSPVGLFMAGALAGFYTTAIMAPGERIKCLLQIQQYAGPVDCAKQIYREGGLLSLYRGSCATLLRDVPASGMYFASYHSIQRIMRRGDPDKHLSSAQILVAGGFAGVFNWLVGMPADVLKTRFQTAPVGMYPKGVRSVFSELMRKEGILALYKGITPVLVRAFPANACCFLGFEYANWFLTLIGL